MKLTKDKDVPSFFGEAGFTLDDLIRAVHVMNDKTYRQQLESILVRCFVGELNE